MPVDLDTIVSLAKRRGFIFQSSEIYGGFGGFWDYGPLGVELKRNVKEAWWCSVVQERPDVVGLDASIVMNPQVWVASGHVENFVEPLVECKQCRRRFRADHLAEAGQDLTKCPECGGQLSEPRSFNTMFKTFVGPVEEDASVAYLRPETAQGIFVNYKNVQTTTRKKLPFGIAQIGKAFRNEITPGRFTFRSREFEQMEVEYFVKPGTDEQFHEYWIKERNDWYVRYGIKADKLRLRPHDRTELAHYAKACTDVEYEFPFGWAEIEGIANRQDYDLTQASKASREDLDYLDDQTNERFVPFVIEPSAGVDRGALVFLLDAYDEEPDKEGTRVVLRFNKKIAPIKVAVLPLSRKETLQPLSQEVWAAIRPHLMTTYDDSQSIGRRYRRQDEIGTPYCVTIDFQSLEDGMVTVRDRDTMSQDRVAIPELLAFLKEKLA